jgi:hypothetical protein
MHELVEQNLLLFKKQKIEIILTKIFRTFSMLYFFVGTNSSLSLREFLKIPDSVFFKKLGVIFRKIKC